MSRLSTTSSPISVLGVAGHASSIASGPTATIPTNASWKPCCWRPGPKASRSHRPPKPTSGADESWTKAPELSTLAKIFDQDCGNLPSVQLGLKTKQPEYVWYSRYQELIIRNFHQNYKPALGLGAAG